MGNGGQITGCRPPRAQTGIPIYPGCGFELRGTLRGLHRTDYRLWRRPLESSCSPGRLAPVMEERLGGPTGPHQYAAL
jgi:hypothetical protein